MRSQGVVHHRPPSHPHHVEKEKQHHNYPCEGQGIVYWSGGVSHDSVHLWANIQGCASGPVYTHRRVSCDSMYARTQLSGSARGFIVLSQRSNTNIHPPLRHSTYRIANRSMFVSGLRPPLTGMPTHTDSMRGTAHQVQRLLGPTGLGGTVAVSSGMPHVGGESPTATQFVDCLVLGQCLKAHCGGLQPRRGVTGYQ